MLTEVCQEGLKEKYSELVRSLIMAATRMREEVCLNLSKIFHTAACVAITMMMIDDDVILYFHRS